MFLRTVFNLTGRRMAWLAIFTKKTNSITDHMVEEYIYNKYINIYRKYENVTQPMDSSPVKIIWTVWLQGEDKEPLVVRKCINSFNKHKGEYKVNLVTLDNLNQYLDIDLKIIAGFKKSVFSAAHLTDYIRMALLSKYGGVWLDATQYLTEEIPNSIWNYDLMLWNKVYDLTGKNAYIAIPFVEKFNNSFLVAKTNSPFFKFGSEITENLLFDPILKLDYFSNFKAYFVAFNRIPLFSLQWNTMPEINPYGLLTRQFWNSPITNYLREYIGSPNSFFFMFTYKKEMKKKVNGETTVEQYIMENY